MPYQSKRKPVKNEDRLWKESAKRVKEDAPWNEFENAANALGYSQDYIDRMYALYQKLNKPQGLEAKVAQSP